MFLFLDVFFIFLSVHLCVKNHLTLNANWQSVFGAVKIIKKYYTHYNFAIIMYHNNRKSPDKAALDPSLIL